MRRDVVNRIERVIKDLWPSARVCTSFLMYTSCACKEYLATNSKSGASSLEEEGGELQQLCRVYVYSAHYLVNLYSCCSNTPVGVFAGPRESCLVTIIAVSNKVYTAQPELVCHFSHDCHTGALVKYFPLDVGNRMLRICN